MKRFLILAAMLLAFSPLSQAQSYYQYKDGQHPHRHHAKHRHHVRCQDGTLQHTAKACSHHHGVRRHNSHH